MGLCFLHQAHCFFDSSKAAYILLRFNLQFILSIMSGHIRDSFYVLSWQNVKLVLLLLEKTKIT